MDSCGCFNPDSVVAPFRHPRTAHHNPLVPRETNPTPIYEGYINDLYVVPNQFACEDIGYGGMRGVKTNVAIGKGSVVVRYIGEFIGPTEAHRRNITGFGGKIALARSHTETRNHQDLYIDGENGGNISCLINHHCDP